MFLSIPQYFHLLPFDTATQAFFAKLLLLSRVGWFHPESSFSFPEVWLKIMTTSIRLSCFCLKCPKHFLQIDLSFLLVKQKEMYFAFPEQHFKFSLKYKGSSKFIKGKFCRHVFTIFYFETIC
jgi:hypothetical protein